MRFKKFPWPLTRVKNKRNCKDDNSIWPSSALTTRNLSGCRLRSFARISGLLRVKDPRYSTDQMSRMTLNPGRISSSDDPSRIGKCLRVIWTIFMLPEILWNYTLKPCFAISLFRIAFTRIYFRSIHVMFIQNPKSLTPNYTWDRTIDRVPDTWGCSCACVCVTCTLPKLSCVFYASTNMPRQKFPEAWELVLTEIRLTEFNGTCNGQNWGFSLWDSK